MARDALPGLFRSPLMCSRGTDRAHARHNASPGPQAQALVYHSRFSAFFKSAPPYSGSQKAGETGPRMVVVLNAALQKREDIARLNQLEDELRLRLAAQAAGAAVFRLGHRHRQDPLGRRHRDPAAASRCIGRISVAPSQRILPVATSQSKAAAPRPGRPSAGAVRLRAGRAGRALASAMRRSAQPPSLVRFLRPFVGRSMAART